MYSYFKGTSCLLKPIANVVQTRNISTTTALMGKRNIRKFFLANKRGTKLHRKMMNAGKLAFAKVYTEVKDTGFMYDDVHHMVPELIPEIIVPDLTDCKLKPYVSYRAADVYQTEFTAHDLFSMTYENKIREDFKQNKLNEMGDPLEPNEDESRTPEEAWTAARRTGSDIFSEREPKHWECLEKSLIDEPEPEIQVTTDDLQIRDGRERLEREKIELAPPLKQLSTSSN